MHERPRHCVYRDLSNVVRAISKLYVSRSALRADLFVDKLFDLLDRLSRRRRTGIPLDETFGLALEERELYLASCLAIVLDEPVDVGSRMSLISGALRQITGGNSTRSPRSSARTGLPSAIASSVCQY
jgi:hypothetical protein